MRINKSLKDLKRRYLMVPALALCLINMVGISEVQASSDVEDLYQKATKFSHSFPQQDNHGTYQFTVQSTMCSKLDDNENPIEDYYYVGLYAHLSPKHNNSDGLYSVFERYDIGIRPVIKEEYTFTLNPLKLIPSVIPESSLIKGIRYVNPYSMDELQVIQSSPQNTQERSSVSSSISHSFSGHLGFFGTTATGGASYSASFSNSESYDITDISIENQSTANEARWRFNILPGSLTSYNTFQPVVQALFHAPYSTRVKASNDLDQKKSFKFEINYATGGELFSSSDLDYYKYNRKKALTRLYRQTETPFHHCTSYPDFNPEKEFTVSSGSLIVNIPMWTPNDN